MCLLIIGLVVTGCGASKGTSNTSPILSGTVGVGDGTVPTSIYYSSGANKEDSEGNLLITLTGSNFGSSRENSVVYYNGYTDANSQVAQKTPLSFENGGSWSPTVIVVKLYKYTRQIYPYGTFSVRVNGIESTPTLRYNFSNTGFNGSNVTSVSPNIVYAYSDNQNMVLTGSGFGNFDNRQDLTLVTMDGYTETISKSWMSWTDTQISFPLPINNLSNSINQTTTVYVRTTDSNNPVNLAQFTFYAPQINYITPLEGGIGKTLIINGQGFGNSQNGMYVVVGDVYANSLSWSNNCIQVRVPYFNSVGPKAIKLRSNNGKEISANYNYDLKAPELISISKNEDISEGDIITLTGRYFCDAADIQALYQNARIEITDTSSNSTSVINSSDLGVTWNDNYITFTWPKMGSSLFSTRTFNVKIVIGSLESGIRSVTD